MNNEIGLFGGLAVVVTFATGVITAAVLAIGTSAIGTSANGPHFQNPALIIMSLAAAVWAGVYGSTKIW